MTIKLQLFAVLNAWVMLATTLVRLDAMNILRSVGEGRGVGLGVAEDVGTGVWVAVGCVECVGTIVTVGVGFNVGIEDGVAVGVGVGVGEILLLFELLR